MQRVDLQSCVQFHGRGPQVYIGNNLAIKTAFRYLRLTGSASCAVVINAIVCRLDGVPEPDRWPPNRTGVFADLNEAVSR